MRTGGLRRMKPALPDKLVPRLLIWLLGFGVISCVIGAVMGIAFNGAGVPLDYLEGSPFNSYVVPGLILGVVVGGTQLLGFIGMLSKRLPGLLLATIAGFGMMIWNFAEVAVIGEYSFLQGIYFGLGILELMSVIALLGIAPSIVGRWRANE
jgi:hypothetical protein